MTLKLGYTEGELDKWYNFICEQYAGFQEKLWLMYLWKCPRPGCMGFERLDPQVALKQNHSVIQWYAM